jgi:inner membrane transporter RhtA
MTQVRQLGVVDRMPPHMFFLVSAIFHYLGPAFAVLLFAQVTILGVTWLRIASAAFVFAIWRRPWRIIAAQSWAQRYNLLAFGVVLGLMNACFYQAIARLPLSTVGAIEFIGPVLLAALGMRTQRNVVALILAAVGGWVLTGVRLGGEPLGYLFAFANCTLFMLYVVLGHRIAQNGGTTGIDRLGLAMLIAMITVSPLGFTDALSTFRNRICWHWCRDLFLGDSIRVRSTGDGAAPTCDIRTPPVIASRIRSRDRYHCSPPNTGRPGGHGHSARGNWSCRTQRA